MKKSSIYRGIFLACTLVLFASCKSSKKEETPVKQLVDPYTGWIYVSEPHISVMNGGVRIELDGDNGTFALYSVNKAGKSNPVLATYDLKKSSFFSVMIDNAEYRLQNNYRVVPESRRTPYGAQMAYSVAGVAEIVIDFSFMPSVKSSDFVDMLRVTVYTINTGIETHTFVLKGLFDTILGENTGIHFSSAAEKEINTGRQYETMARDKWISSSDGSTSVQFILSGQGVTVPQYVTLANKEQTMQSWIPVVVPNQGFHSIHSYNNSALAINYKSCILDSLKSDVCTFFIAFASDEEVPNGEDFLASLEEGKISLPIYSTDDEGNIEVPLLPEYEGDSQTQADILYAQQLVNKIKNMDNVEKEEFEKLNKELDEIMKRLQQEK